MAEMVWVEVVGPNWSWTETDDAGNRIATHRGIPNGSVIQVPEREAARGEGIGWLHRMSDDEVAARQAQATVTTTDEEPPDEGGEA